MTEYKNLPENYALFKKPFIKAIPVLLILIIGCVAFSYFTETRGADYFQKDVYFILVLFIGMFCYVFYRTNKRQKEVYYSYQFVVGGNYLLRRQGNLPDITLPFNEITQISPYKGGLLVKGSQNEQSMVVWPYIEKYEEVKALLSSVCPITPFAYKNVLQKYPMLLSGLMIACMAGVYASDNKIIVAISGAINIAILVWFFYKIRTAKQLDSHLKKNWWLFALVLLSVIATMYYKLSI